MQDQYSLFFELFPGICFVCAKQTRARCFISFFNRMHKSMKSPFCFSQHRRNRNPASTLFSLLCVSYTLCIVVSESSCLKSKEHFQFQSLSGGYAMFSQMSVGRFVRLSPLPLGPNEADGYGGLFSYFLWHCKIGPFSTLLLSSQ